MESPKNAALKTHNQSIAEKGLLDKIESVEKELSGFVAQVERIVQAVEAGTISNEQAQLQIEKIYDKLEDLQAERDGLRKELKEVGGRVSTIETAIAEMMETEDETKSLLDNARRIFKRLEELEATIHSEHVAIHQKVSKTKEYVEDHFFYFYIMFGISIFVSGLSIVINIALR